MATQHRSPAVLYVENDRLIARAARRVFGRLGRPVRWVPTCGQARLAAPAEGPYAVGVFDIDLDDGSGVELAQDLLNAGLVSQALFFTGCREPAVIAKAKTMGTVVPKSRGLLALLNALPRPTYDTGIRRAALAGTVLRQAPPSEAFPRQVSSKTAG